MRRSRVGHRVGRGLLIVFGVLLVASAVTDAQRRSAPIKFGTIVPRGSLWDETLSAMAQQWRSISGGSVRVVVYPGGALGDEIEMVRKVLLGQLDGVALSSVGLSRIDSSVACLQVPLLLNSYGELDYVRDHLAPRLEQRIEAQGFKVLNWADGGWVRVFSRDATRIPDDLRRVKLFTSSGDPEMERLYKRLRFRVVPLSMVDLVTSLQTGMVDAVPSVPLFAQLQGLHKLVPNMLDLKLTPLVGGTVISTGAWNRLPAEHRDALLQAAQEAGMQLREPIRQLGEDTIAEMASRGLNVATLDAATRAVWRDEVEAIYPNLRGDYCPADIFDEVVRLRDEYRAVQ